MDAVTALAMSVLASAVGIIAMVVLVRLSGLRSLAKFAPHDFVATVALGSVLAATAARSVPLPIGVTAMAAIFLVQRIISRWRLHGGDDHVDNNPLLLMAEHRVQWDAMALAGVTVDDLRAKLREANVVQLEQIRAVVLEGTGDISVLHTSSADEPLDPLLLGDVRGAGTQQCESWSRPLDTTDPFVRKQ